MRKLQHLIIFMVIFTLFGCSNPYCNPNTSKAVDEREQTTEMKRQTEQLHRIADALDTLAVRETRK